MALNRRQAIIWTNDGLVHWRKHASLGADECNETVWDMLLNIDSGNGLAPSHGPLARYVKSQIAHAPGMPGTFSPPPRFSDPGMHHGTCVIPGSLTSGFLWSRWRGKSSRHSRRMRNPQFYVSGKRPITWTNADLLSVRPEEHISMKFHMKFKALRGRRYLANVSFMIKSREISFFHNIHFC